MRVTVTMKGCYDEDKKVKVNKVSRHHGVVSIVRKDYDKTSFIVLKDMEGIVIDCYPINDVKKITITIE